MLLPEIVVGMPSLLQAPISLAVTVPPVMVMAPMGCPMYASLSVVPLPMPAAPKPP